MLDKRLGQATEGTEVLHTLPGPLPSSRTPSADAGAGCGVSPGEPGIPPWYSASLTVASAGVVCAGPDPALHEDLEAGGFGSPR